MRTITVAIPNETCNKCIFFSVRCGDGDWGPVHRCRLFSQDLTVDKTQIIRQVSTEYSMENEYKAFPCRECLIEGDRL